MAWIDGFSRVHDDLRVSVTDRCNLRCSYCMPEEPEWFPRSEILSYEELHRVVRILASRGVRKVRITGGEPLVRADLSTFVEWIASTPGIEDVSLTTNGVLLAPALPAMAKAGLQRVNVSLDTMRADRFERLTGRDLLHRVLEGLDAAVAEGLVPVKVNTVLMRGVNDDEVENMARVARERRWEIRFIEFMPLENDGSWDRKRVVPGREVRERLERLWPMEPARGTDPRAPATRWTYRDGGGAVGFIDSVTAPFCADCSRLRLTADGKFRVCLYDDAETELKGPLRSGATDDEVARLLASALQRKGRGGALDLLDRRPPGPRQRTMHQIGG